jgi:hypothetical protein
MPAGPVGPNGTILEGIRAANDGRFAPWFRDYAYSCDGTNQDSMQIHPWISPNAEIDLRISVGTNRGVWTTV